MPDDDDAAALADPEWLDGRLAAGEVWHGGRVVAIGAERIGLGYGLSGAIHRLHCTTDVHDHVTLVAKVDDRALTRRAVEVHGAVGSHLGRSKPALLGHDLERFDDAGVLLLEDIRPAHQGDDLVPIGPERAADLVSVVARLHRTPVDGPAASGLDRWSLQTPDPARWEESLARLAPQLDRRFGRGWRPRFERLEAEAAEMSVSLTEHPFVLTHGDPHLDNVLWRPDGSTVLLDWSSGRLAPAALDAAMLMSSLCLSDDPAMHPDDLVAALDDGGAEPFETGVRAALTLLIRGQLGWAGRPADTWAHPRVEALLDAGFQRIARAITWLDLGVVSGRSRR